MEERAEILRRRITFFRHYLARGIDADLAQHYLAAIAADEAELAQIESRDHDKRR